MSNLPQYVSCISRTTFLMVDTLYVCIDAYLQHNRAATKARANTAAQTDTSFHKPTS